MWSSPQGWGKITLAGSIVDTACNIDMDSRDQTVYMGALPVSTLNNIGRGPVKTFGIKLTDCHFDRYSRNGNKWSSLVITFDGLSENELFLLSGESMGARLLITDKYNNKVIPGVASQPLNVSLGTMHLKYNLQIVKSNELVKSGNYWTLLRFKIDYN
ncbi:TPA: type 1 fimbrial protein [Morganella morganii]|nr:type 1 fimbrial protein [Morganella morganii]